MWLMLLWFLQAPVADLPGAKLYVDGRFQEAHQSLEASPDEPAKHFWLGYTLLALGRRPEAISEFERYLAANPKDEDVLYAVARTYAQLADMSFQQVFALDPKSARSYQLRGIRDELENRWHDAIAHYRAALKIDPKLRGVHSAIARIYESELRQPVLARAARLREPKSRMEAVQVGELLRERASQPKNPDVYFRLGEACAEMKRRTTARVKAANPSSYRLHQLQAEDLAAIHRKAEAVAEYRTVLAMQPTLPGVHYELARLLTDSDPVDAAKLLRTELVIDENHYKARSLLGQLLVATGEYGPAIGVLEQALAANPDLTDARRALGRALVETKDAENGLRHLLMAASAEQDDEQIHFLLANAYRALGREREAAVEMETHREVLRRLAKQ
jgi:tetratricopeptide (TPR) repeat protein